MREPRTQSPAPTGPRPPVRRTAGRTTAGRSIVAPHHTASRHQREEHYQRLSLIGAGVIVLVVAALLGFGWYQSYVSPYRQTVLVVGNHNVTMEYFIKRVKEFLPQFANSNPQVVVTIVPAATQEQIEQDLILLQRASQLGISATDQEVDTQVAQQLGIVTNNGAAPDRNALESALHTKLGATGLTLAEYRDEARASVLRTKVQAKLGADFPKTAPEAKYEQILMNKEADANKLADRLKNGDSWDAVVADVRKDTASGTVAQFDFQPKLQIDDKLVGPLFDLKPGDHTGVIGTADGKFAIARLIDKDDQHPVTDDQVKAITPKLFSNWLADQKKAITIKEKLTDDQKLFAIVHSGYVPPTSSQQTQQTVPSNPVTLPPGIATPTGGLTIPSIPPGAAPPPAAGTAAP